MIYPGVGVGINIYQDGKEIGSALGKTVESTAAGNGQVVVGKRNFGEGDRYTSFSLDEIKFYNRQLSEKEISDMYRRIG